MYRHHSDDVYTIIHQERRTRKEFRWYFLLFCFNVTGGKRMRERHDGHLNDGHPRVYVCAAVLCRIGLYNVWLCYWVFFSGRLNYLSRAFCHLRQYCRFNGRAIGLFVLFFIFYFLAKAKPISHPHYC